MEKEKHLVGIFADLFAGVHHPPFLLNMQRKKLVKRIFRIGELPFLIVPS